MPAYLNRMPAGIPGDVSRKEGAVIESSLTGAKPIPYGAFVKLVSGKLEPLAASDAAAVIYGLAVRPYPKQSDAVGFGPASAPAGSLCDVLRSGYMTVTLKSGTAARGGQVHVRVTAAGGKSVGDIEAAADAENTVAVTGCTFMGPADADGHTEIAYNI